MFRFAVFFEIHPAASMTLLLLSLVLLCPNIRFLSDFFVVSEIQIFRLLEANNEHRI